MSSYRRFFLFLLMISSFTQLQGEELDLDEVEDGSSLLGSSGFDSLSDVKEEDTGIYPKSEAEKKELLKKVLSAGLKKPGAWSRISQVLPIVRIMSAPQRLALASLVMAQVLAGPSDPALPPIPVKGVVGENLTAELMLPISMDIATMFRGLGREQSIGRSSRNPLNQLYSIGGSKLRPLGGQRRKNPNPGINRRNANAHPSDILVPPRLTKPTSPTIANNDDFDYGMCERFMNSICLQTQDYPLEEIVRSMKNTANKAAFGSLLTDAGQDIAPETVAMERSLRDVSNEGHMCSSSLEIVRPKRARATSGVWKYIVNTAEYTQTLRLELCLKPGLSCSYLSDDVDSQCAQVYNYHRLLTWDENHGLTMDIFKVPTCCSCHIQRFQFPKHEETSTRVGPDNSESNLVGDDRSRQKNQSPKLKGVLMRPGYVPPKRIEMVGSRRPPQLKKVQHRGPPLPLEEETPPHPPRYPPNENNLRRTTRNNTGERVKYGVLNLPPGGPNQRHPALPAESIVHVTRIIPHPPLPPSSRPREPLKKINYSYHPIIDFFRTPSVFHPSTLAMESRIGGVPDWTPITDQPRSLNGINSTKEK